MSKKFYIILSVIGLFVAGLLVLKLTGFGAAILWKISGGGVWILPLIVVSSLIDSVNPCAFSVLLITIAFLLSASVSRRRIFEVGGSYIFGIFAVYLLIGLGLLQALHLFNTPHFMAKAGATLVVLFGLINLTNHYFPTFPIKLKIPNFAHGKMAALIEKGSVTAAFILGVLVGLCEFPCTGGPYLMALGLLHDHATYLKGVGYLILYNIIFILPLILILLLASEKSLITRFEEWRAKNTNRLKFFDGWAMIILGLLIFLL
jgi:cytochrome c biogenesis protein CcdA